MQAFASMFKMFVQFFNALSVFGVAVEKGAKSIENLATMAELTTNSMVEESKIVNASKLKKLQLSLDAELGIVATQ